MSVQMVLLPVFVLIGLAFALLLGMAVARTRSLRSGETRFKDIALREPNWSVRATQIANCFSNQFEVPVLFYVLIALALPLRHADLVIVVLSWVFVLTRFVHAGIFVTSNNVPQRGMAWFAGVVVLMAMWIYFALRILLV
ncbi:MAPEG family protein [Nitrobacter sp.]|uniref:MAPEG family protein n=1 Tax=Nitrobacter sp. TaxID=29420 RepID=UPI003F64E48B